MKKIIYGTLITILALASSCRKGSNLPVSSWSFAGSKYSTTNSTGNSSAGTLSCISGSSSTLALYLNSFPATTGTTTYTVVNGINPASANQIGIALLNGTNTYLSTGGNGTNETVSVTLENDGFLSVTGSNIELLNVNVTTDSSALTFNVTQTQ